MMGEFFCLTHRAPPGKSTHSCVFHRFTSAEYLCIFLFIHVVLVIDIIKLKLLMVSYRTNVIQLA